MCFIQLKTVLENTSHPLSIPSFPLDRPVICKWSKHFIGYCYCYQSCACALIFYNIFQFRRNIGSMKKGKHRLCSPVEYHPLNVLYVVFLRENLQLFRYNLIDRFLLAEYRHAGSLLSLNAYVLLLDLVSFHQVCRYRCPVYAESVVYLLQGLCYLRPRYRFPVWK